VEEGEWRRLWERAVRDSTAYPDAWLGPAISRATVRAVDKALTEAREELDHVSADLIEAHDARLRRWPVPRQPDDS